MIQLIFITLLGVSSLFAIEATERIFECTKIFEERKGELLVELERLDEQRQALDALKTATDELLNKKEVRLQKQQSDVDMKLAEAKEREENIQKMLDENKKVLNDLKNAKMNSISQTYAKMKAGAAAQILNDMNVSEASKILASLKPKTVGKILSKMDPKKASDITLELTKTPK